MRDEEVLGPLLYSHINFAKSGDDGEGFAEPKGIDCSLAIHTLDTCPDFEAEFKELKLKI